MKKTTLTLFLTMFLLVSFAQKKKKVEYTPVTNVSMEDVFPVAAYMLKFYYGGDVDRIEWGKKYMRSYYINYEKLLGGSYRLKVNYQIDESNALDIKFDPVENYGTDTKKWYGAPEGKRENEIRIEIAEYIKNKLSNPDSVQKAKDWFYTNLRINFCFFESATELAGNRWFELYLKNKPVKWNIPFEDVKTNKANNYKYAEEYSAELFGIESDANYVKKFAIVKYTDSDKNVMTSKKTTIMVEGYFRSLQYNNGLFTIVLTDKIDSPLPKTSAQATEQKGGGVLENAEKLKQLKSLLDSGAITKQEYDEEKRKILNGK